MLHLSVKIDELETAMEHQDAVTELRYYLDLETGAIDPISMEEDSYLDKMRARYSDPEGNAIDWSAVVEQLDIPEWQRPVVARACEIEFDTSNRFLSIPQRSSSDGYAEMEEFIETISAPGLRARLEDAIIGKGAFRRFRSVLEGSPKEKERWHAFQAGRQRQFALEWLEEQGIQAI